MSHQRFTPMELKFVLVHEGDDVAAARTAGYKNPNTQGARLMSRPHIRKAVEAKHRKAVEESGKQLGRKLTKCDVIEGLLQLAKLNPEKTRNTITGQVTAWKTIAEIESFLIRKTQDLPPDFDNRTDEEKEFFSSHGYWPTSVDAREPGATASESASQNPPKPN